MPSAPTRESAGHRTPSFPPAHAHAPAVSWPEARRIARAAGLPSEPVELPLARTAGATLAADLRALSPLPAQDVSAMDGYAVAGPGPWTVRGQILAGANGPPPPLRAGEAYEIATGAPVPPTAGAVLTYETATVHGGTVYGSVAAGRHIRARGEDCPAGRQLLPAGAPVTPAMIGLAASTGHDTLLVRRPPTVSALLTGTELTGSGLPTPGLVRDAIGPMLPGLVHGLGGRLLGAEVLADDRRTLAEALRHPAADVLLVCGATSVGAADHLRAVLAELGAEVLVAGVLCRPGHPQLLASLPDGRCLVGLPGNPYAAVAAALTLLGPLLERLSGRTPAPPRTVRLAGVTPHPRDTRLVPVRLAGPAAEPVGHDRPGMLLGAALADALAVIPPAGRAVEASAEAEVRDVRVL
ncbi:MAG TPA: molybdopterin molybdenumtransferase MoeA, partial [Streptomyces sp.]|nr:molybdopterin molybdenumtransferase MoeA [Streptomyces sp.]